MKTLLTVAAILGMSSFMYASILPQPNVIQKSAEMVEMENAVMVLSVVNAFRKNMVEDPVKGVQYHLEGIARDSWERHSKSAELSEVPLRDFFLGAVSMAGAISEKGSIAALYNPWQDGILLMQLGAVKAQGEEKIPLIEKVVFLCGEAFRSEPLEPLSVTTVVPNKEIPLSVNIWEKTIATIQHFDHLYPADRKAKLHTREWNIKPMVDRTALRLKWMSRMAEGKGGEWTRASLLARVLKVGNKERLLKVFPEPNTDFYCTTWAEVPLRIRQSLVPYGWYAIAGEKGREMMLTFVCAELPTCYVTVSLRAGKPASMEWFDLKQAPQLLETWKSNQAK